MNSKKDEKKITGISAHFEREAKLMMGCFLIPLLLVILAGVFGPWVLRQMEIDKCLDRGGSFDKENNDCKLSSEIKQNQK